MRLNEQLDKRSSRILAKTIHLDSSPPSMLINSPSITLPKSLSCLLLANVSFIERTSGQDLSRNSISPPHLDDPRVWIPLLTKYLQPEAQRLIDQILQTHYRIYVLFDLPDYSHFKFLELADDSDEMLDQEDSIIDRESSTVQLQESESGEQQKELLVPKENKRHSLAHHPAVKSHELAERDRSISLDSPLKAPSSQEQQPSKALNSLVANLFVDNPSEATTASASTTDTKTRPPIPSSSASFPNPRGSVSTKRTSIDELRVALQSDPTQHKSSSAKGGKKKNFFGWKSSS